MPHNGQFFRKGPPPGPPTDSHISMKTPTRDYPYHNRSASRDPHGKWLSARFTRPLTELSAGASAYHAGDFGYRIPTPGNDEFTDVARAMNEMAERVSDQIADLEGDAERRRQFLADVAHELRSPVTTMRTMAGALSEGLANDPQRSSRAVEALVRTSERLLRLVTT